MKKEKRNEELLLSREKKDIKQQKTLNSQLLTLNFFVPLSQCCII